MAVVHTFTPDDIDAIRCYCEGQLRDEVARVAVWERDHGACIGLIVELMNGRRIAYGAAANGIGDSDAGKQLVEAIRREMAKLRQASH